MGSKIDRKPLRWRGSAASQLSKTDSQKSKWDKFKRIIQARAYGPVHKCFFHPQTPGRLFAASGFRIMELNGLEESENQRNFLSLESGVASVAVRDDGNLVAVGTAAGAIIVMDSSTRKFLRKIEGHSSGVHHLSFLADNRKLISAGDDSIVNLWDISDGSCLWSKNYQKGLIKGISKSAGTFVICFQDGLISLLDPTDGTEHASMKLDEHIENFTRLDDNHFFGTIDGSIIALELTNDGNFTIVNRVEAHHKKISGIAHFPHKDIIISSSFDHNVKILRADNLDVLRSIKFPSPVLNVDCSSDSNFFVAGCADGTIHVFGLSKIKKKAELRDKTRRGSDFPDSAISQISRHKVEDCFRGFRYAKALDFALQKQHSGLLAYTIEFLCRREGLIAAISGRNSVDCITIISKLAKMLQKPRHQKIGLHFLHQFFSLYRIPFTYSGSVRPVLDDLLQRLTMLQNNSETLLNCWGSLLNVVGN